MKKDIEEGQGPDLSQVAENPGRGGASNPWRALRAGMKRAPRDPEPAERRMMSLVFGAVVVKER